VFCGKTLNLEFKRIKNPENTIIFPLNFFPVSGVQMSGKPILLKHTIAYIGLLQPTPMTTTEIRSYPERLIGWVPLPNWLTLLLLWEGIFLADYIFSIQTDTGAAHLMEFGCLLLFFALVCISIIYCSRVLTRLFADLLLFIDHPEEELASWYNARLKQSYTGIWPLVFGLVFMIAESYTVGYSIRQFTPSNTVLFYLRLSYELAGFFLLGVGLWALINVLLIPIGLTKFRIRVSVNQISGRGLQALGAAFFKMSLAITITFVPLVMAAIISPLIEDLSILIWLGAGTAAIFGFFLFPQIGIHRIMAFEKQQRLLSFAVHLEDAMERSLKEPTSENMQRLKEMFDLQSHLKNMNEWPFNVNTIWQLITALLIPLFLAMLEIFF
jgi:hypothetical protein